MPGCVVRGVLDEVSETGCSGRGVWDWVCGTVCDGVCGSRCVERCVWDGVIEDNEKN